MTKLLKSGALSFKTDPLDKRLKLVKRGDVARLAAVSYRRQDDRPTRCHTSRKKERVKADDLTYTFTIAEITMLLYVFVPYAVWRAEWCGNFGIYLRWLKRPKLLASCSKQNTVQVSQCRTY